MDAGLGEAGCAWTGPLSARQAHLDGDCGLEPVACSLADLGCDVRPERRALAAHTSEAAPRHVELMAVALASQGAAHATRLGQLEAVTSAQAARIAQLEGARPFQAAALSSEVAASTPFPPIF